MTEPAADMVEEACESCGRRFMRPAGRRRHRCMGCKMAMAVEMQDQIAAKSGPLYEVWLRRWRFGVARGVEHFADKGKPS